MYIPQAQTNHVKKLLKPGKVVVVYGPRRVGKTTLIKKILENESNYLFVSGEDFFVQKLPDHQQHCDLGDINFTCAVCGSVTHFSFRGAIFRDLNFYCGGCGVGYKLNNPLFNTGSKSRAT